MGILYDPLPNKKADWFTGTAETSHILYKLRPTYWYNLWFLVVSEEASSTSIIVSCG